MIVGVKDGFKFIGVAVVCACATFVLTFFLNYRLDALAVDAGTLSEEARALYDAQLVSAKITCAVTGGCLALIAAALTVFYVGVYIDSRAQRLGVLKALGYSDGRLAAGFLAFGLSVFVGSAAGHGAGYAFSPIVYRLMSDGLIPLTLRYHTTLTVCLVLLPTALFAALAALCALVKLRRPALSLIRGKAEREKHGKDGRAERSFLRDCMLKTPARSKLLTFFVAIAGFCYGTMLQMSRSMKELSSVTMGAVMLLIGVVLSVTAFALAMTSLTRANAKTVALMRAYGYSLSECGAAVFGGFRLFAYLGFAVGTVYQYGLLKLMTAVVFRGVAGMPAYTFDVKAFFVTLATFLVLYEAAIAFFTYRIGKTPLKNFIAE